MIRTYVVRETTIFLLTLQFLTRLPVPKSLKYTPEAFAATTRYYPLVGLVTGGLMAGAYGLSTYFFSHFTALLLTLTLGILITGAFHEDGLADTCDGIGGGQNREQALDIMKDSRIGTYGTIALICVLALKISALYSVPPAFILAVIIMAQCLSRFSCLCVMTTSQYARDHGTGKPVASDISLSNFLVALIIVMMSLGLTGNWVPIIIIAGGCVGLCVGHVLMRLFFEPKLQGYTGDTLGAVQQMSELGFYLGIVACL